MASKRAARRTTKRIGMATAILGAVVAVTALTSAPATADGHDTAEYICHRTNNPGEPYVMQTPNEHGADGNGANDHTLHGGEVFDFEAYAAHLANPTEVSDPYPPPRNGDQWGDIIPDVLNWSAEGQAIHAADCGAPPVDVCPDDEGVQTSEDRCTVDVCPDDEGVQTSEDQCTVIDNGQAVTVCHATGSAANPFEKVGVNYHAADGSDNAHLGHAGDIIPPYGDFAGLNWTAANEAIWENGCEETVVEGEVIVRPAPKPQAPAPQVQPATQSQVQPAVQPVVEGRTFLPKTGADDVQLAYIGLGLVLIGAGLVVSTRVELRTA